MIMSDFESAERRTKGSLREVQRNLRAVSSSAYALHPTLFALVVVIFAVALVEVIPLMHSAVLYATVAAVLFLILGCILYVRRELLKPR
jgi:Flp pilus assembly protein TadB